MLSFFVTPWLTSYGLLDRVTRMTTHPRQLVYALAIYTVGRSYEFILIHLKQLLSLLFNSLNFQTILTGGDMLRVINFGLAQPPFSDQF